MPTLPRIGLLAAALALAGCATPVLQQRVPVSTDPPGATARDDSGSSCVTPCALSLDRNRDHIVMLELAGYQSQDVVIQRQYRTADVLLSAINSGINSARTFNNPSWALQSGMSTMNAKEQSGAAYDLVPSVVSVRLQALGSQAYPDAAAPSQPAPGYAPSDLLAQLGRNDQNMLEQALESAPTGRPTAWNNPEMALRFSVVADNVELRDSQVLRPFTLSVGRQEQWSSARYLALRVGRGEWQVMATPVPTPAAAHFLPLGEFHLGPAGPVGSGPASPGGVDVSPGATRPLGTR